MVRRTVAAFVVMLLVAPGAGALSDGERELLGRSIRDGELEAVEAATGGLASLPLAAVEIELDFDARRFRGHARLDWPNGTGRALDSVVFRLSAHGGGSEAPSVRWTALTASIAGGKAAKVEAKAINQTHWRVKLPRKLAPGERVALFGRLEGHLASLAPGATDLVTSSLGALSGAATRPDGEQYGTFACGDGICTLTGFVPQVPAVLDGAFDTHEASGIGDATYSEPMNALVTVVAPSGVKFAASGVEVGRVPAGKGRTRTSFAVAAARDFGLVASEAFVVQTEKVGGVTVRSFSLRRHSDAGRRVLDAARTSLPHFDQAFGRYPWSTLDVAESALVGGAGGVELPALTLIAKGLYDTSGSMLQMFDPSGTTTRSMLDFVTRHEVAHQWWHAQVGSHSQRHPYVDEPLAQWSALHSVRRAQGDEAAAQVRDTQIALNYRALAMMGETDGKVARPAGAFRSHVQYAGLVYGKAPLFYEALRAELGEEALLAGLRSLVARRRFARATPDDLLESLMGAAGDKAPRVAALWKRWFEQTHGDEDVGTLDMAGLLGSMGVMGGRIPSGLLDPDTLKKFQNVDAVTFDEALRMLEEMHRQLGGE